MHFFVYPTFNNRLSNFGDDPVKHDSENKGEIAWKSTVTDNEKKGVFSLSFLVVYHRFSMSSLLSLSLSLSFVNRTASRTLRPVNDHPIS